MLCGWSAHAGSSEVAWRMAPRAPSMTVNERTREGVNEWMSDSINGTCTMAPRSFNDKESGEKFEDTPAPNQMMLVSDVR